MRKFTFIFVVFLGSIFMLGCQKEVSIDSRINPPTQQALLNLGDSAQGGIVYYILQPGDTGYDANVQHGLIASTVDNGVAPFNPGPFPNLQNPTLVSSAIGNGNSNTNTIVNFFSPTFQNNTYAAGICYNLTLNGYNDWYLPSEAELSLLREFVLDSLNINNPNLSNFMNSFVNLVYWSSSSDSLNAGFVWMCEVSIMILYFPSAPLGVRAIRSF